MNSIQKSLMAVLAMLLCLNIAQAQGPRGGGGPDMDPEKRAEKQTEAMVEQLGLNEEQTAQITDLNLAFAQKAKELRDNAESRESVREAMKTAHEEHVAALKNVLTEEQFQTWEAKAKKRGPENGKRKGRKQGGKKNRN